MISRTIHEYGRNYLCDDCKKEVQQFKSLMRARAAGWAISRDRKNCFCPKCAPRHRNVGCYGGVCAWR